MFAELKIFIFRFFIIIFLKRSVLLILYVRTSSFSLVLTLLYASLSPYLHTAQLLNKTKQIYKSNLAKKNKIAFCVFSPCGSTNNTMWHFCFYLVCLCVPG